MKVSIIGGAGRVGSNAAYALQIGGIVKELALIDVMKEVAAGEALDLRHGASVAASQRIYAGGYEVAEGSDIVMVTAGLRRKPDESRLQLINRNVTLFKSVCEEIKKVKLSEHCILFVVANPVDILTYLGIKLLGFPSHRVIGLGTVLDTTRFRSMIAEKIQVDPTKVNALILGEHGDSMVPIWSSATVNGILLSSMPGFTENVAKETFEFTKKSGAEVIKLKGGAGYAVGLAIKEVTEAIALNKQSVLPVSSLQSGMFDMRDVCLSVPTIVGRKGVEKLIEPVLSPKEKTDLQNSAKVLGEILKQIQL